MISPMKGWQSSLSVNLGSFPLKPARDKDGSLGSVESVMLQGK